MRKSAFSQALAGHVSTAALLTAFSALIAGVSASNPAHADTCNTGITTTTLFDLFVMSVAATDSGAGSSGAGSIACGPNAIAAGSGATSVGGGAYALNSNAAAIGARSWASGANSIGIGFQPALAAGAFGDNSIAIGTNARAGEAGSIAIGGSAQASGLNSVALGAGATAPGDFQIVLGTSAHTVIVDGATSLNGGVTVTGDAAADSLTVNGGTTQITSAGVETNALAVDGDALVDGNQTVAGTLDVAGPASLNGGATVANGLTVTSGGASVTGNSNVTGDLTISGNTLTASLNVTSDAAIGNDVNVGRNANIGGDLGVAGASTFGGRATFNGGLSVAPRQTVDMGGNRVRGVGAPMLATDAANKAYVDDGLTKAKEGAAIAVAMAQPILLAGQTFAVRGGWGAYENQNAFALAAAGVVSRNVFGPGTTATIDGGFGFGTDEGTVAGRAGVTFGW